MKKLVLLVTFGLLCTSIHAGLVGVGLTDVPTSFTDGVLLISGSGLTATTVYDDAPQSSINGCTFVMDTELVAGTHFEGGTFELKDNLDSPLFGGDVLSVDFAFVLGLMAGHGEATVLVDNISGGDLLGESEIVTITFDIPVTDFEQNFDGALTKVDFNIPEPATLALLGLGGLLLRRRK